MTDAPNPTVQVAFDAADPHRVAHFWAAALGYEKEDNSAFVKQLLDAGRLPEAATIETENGREFADVAACRDPDGRRPRLFFQRVPETKTVKNRLHLDLRVGDRARTEAAAARLVERGATVLHHGRQGPHTWITMADPVGNEFCVSESAPPAS